MLNSIFGFHIPTYYKNLNCEKYVLCYLYAGLQNVYGIRMNTFDLNKKLILILK